MRLLGALAVAAGLLAEEPAPIGVVRGHLVECDPALSGELRIRTADQRVYRFLFDLKTYVERDSSRISVTKLLKGDPLEIVSDYAPGISLRYARMVHVVEDPPPPHRASVSLGRLRLYRSPTEHIAPRGDLTFSGLIAQLTEHILVLRTRLDGKKFIHLRQDTCYLESGLPVELSTLQPSMRVFVRAGKNLDDEIEAYQVVWGEILSPDQR